MQPGPRRRARGARAAARDERRRARGALGDRGARREGGDARGEGRAVDARGAAARGARRPRRRDRALQARARREPARTRAASAALRAGVRARAATRTSVVALIETELDARRGQPREGAPPRRARARAARRSCTTNDEGRGERAKTAIELDPTNADALLVLGDLAFEGERYLEATQAPTSRSSAAPASLPKEDAVRVARPLHRGASASAASRRASSVAAVAARRTDGSRDVAPAAGPCAVATTRACSPRSRRSQQLAPDDVETRSRASRRVIFEHGDAQTRAQDVRGRLLEQARRGARRPDRADALYRLGESRAALGRARRRRSTPLREAADLDPSNPEPLRALAQGLRAEGRLARRSSARKRRRLEVARRAGALRAPPRDRRRRVPEARTTARARQQDVRRRARGAPRRPQAADEADAALLGGEGLGEARRGRAPPRRLRRGPEAAREVHAHGGDRALAAARRDRPGARLLRPRPRVRPDARRRRSTRPSSCAAQKGDHDGVERLLKMQLEQAKQAQDRAKIVADPRPARRALSEVPERAGARHRRLRGRAGVRSRRTASAPRRSPSSTRATSTQYLDKAVKAQAQILRRNPYRVESYKLLRTLYTEAKQRRPGVVPLPGARRAEPRRARRGALLPRHRADNAAPAQAVLDEEDWSDSSRTRTRTRSSRASSRSSSRPSSARARSRSRRSATIRATRSTCRCTRTRSRRRSTTCRACSAFAAPLGVPEPERSGGARLPPRAHAGDRARARGVRERRCRRSRSRSSPAGT